MPTGGCVLVGLEGFHASTDSIQTARTGHLAAFSFAMYPLMSNNCLRPRASGNLWQMIQHCPDLGSLGKR